MPTTATRPARARKKKPVIAEGITQEQATQQLGEYAKAFNTRKALEAKMELRINKIREEFQEELNSLTETIDEVYEILNAYGMQNLEKFAEKKSLDMVHGTIGFRTGNPKLEKPKSITWEEMAYILTDKKYNAFVRIKTEVDKEAIISGRDTLKVQSLLKDCQLNVVQDECFFVVPKE